jgi:hypothetical protein
MTKDDVLGLPANLREPGDVRALTGFLPGESFNGFFTSLPENQPVFRHVSVIGYSLVVYL